MNTQKRKFFKRVIFLLSAIVIPFAFKKANHSKSTKYVWFLNKSDK
jgi:hypothetical protein